MAFTNEASSSLGEHQKSAFDEILVTEPVPIIVTSFPYSINTSLVNTRKNGSGTVTQSGVSAVVSSAASTDCVASMTWEEIF